MKTGTLNQYLNLVAASPSDLATRRQIARQTWHTIAQCVADGGYPERCLATFPPLGAFRRLTQSAISEWWSSFRAWLCSLTVRERRCLAREVVILPAATPAPKVTPRPARITSSRARTASRLSTRREPTAAEV